MGLYDSDGKGEVAGVTIEEYKGYKDSVEVEINSCLEEFYDMWGFMVTEIVVSWDWVPSEDGGEPNYHVSLRTSL